MLFPSLFIWRGFWCGSFREEKDGAPLQSLLWGFPAPYSHRVCSALFTAFTSLFIPFQGMCRKPEEPRNKDDRTSFKFPCLLDCPTWDCSMHLISVILTILLLRSSSKDEIPLFLSLSLSSCGTAKHISRHFFVLCLKNTTLTRGAWSL